MSIVESWLNEAPSIPSAPAPFSDAHLALECDRDAIVSAAVADLGCDSPSTREALTFLVGALDTSLFLGEAALLAACQPAAERPLAGHPDPPPMSSAVEALLTAVERVLPGEKVVDAPAASHAWGAQASGRADVTMLVADALVERLQTWGIHRIFGYSGDGIDPILAAMNRADGDPRLVTARHEESAAFMATAHAKWTGGTGCCLATHGPGAIHLLNGLYDAKLDKKPVVAIIAQQHRTALGSGYQQEIDARSLFKDVCGAYLNTVTTPEQLRLVVDRAVRTAQAVRAPTCVIIPHDVQQLEMPEDLPHEHGMVPSSPGWAQPHVIPPDDALTPRRGCSTQVSASPSSPARARPGPPRSCSPSPTASAPG